MKLEDRLYLIEHLLRMLLAERLHFRNPPRSKRAKDMQRYAEILSAEVEMLNLLAFRIDQLSADAAGKLEARLQGELESPGKPARKRRR